MRPHPMLLALGALAVTWAAAAATAPEAIDEAAMRRAIESHYATAADPKQIEVSSALYADDAVLEFPQGGERIRGKANIVAFRSADPARVTFDLRRTVGQGELWVNEGVIRYDDERPHHFVGIMEWRGVKVVRETIYFGEPWTPPAWRARWVEPLR
ncbi:MAG: nuclear transport factor 2 family protein [Vicinamibacteria bacterium]